MWGRPTQGGGLGGLALGWYDAAPLGRGHAITRRISPRQSHHHYLISKDANSADVDLHHVALL
ncbi:MAG: hypothetical protein QOJ40_1253 [Verrucomicrobiota bacterium]